VSASNKLFPSIEYQDLTAKGSKDTEEKAMLNHNDTTSTTTENFCRFLRALCSLGSLCRCG